MSEGNRRDGETFANAQLELEELPALAALQLAPVSRRYAPYAALVQILGWGGAAAALWALPIPAHIWLAGHPATPWALVAIAAVAACLAWLDANRRGFALREHDVVYARGLLVRTTIVAPIARIQHIETSSGPLERRFGLRELTCYTAGGHRADLVLRGLDFQLAEQVRDQVLERIERRARPAGDDAPIDTAEAEAGEPRDD